MTDPANRRETREMEHIFNCDVCGPEGRLVGSECQDAFDMACRHRAADREERLAFLLSRLKSAVTTIYDEVWSEAREHIAGCDVCYGSGGRHSSLCGACDEAVKFRKRLDRLEEALGL